MKPPAGTLFVVSLTASMIYFGCTKDMTGPGDETIYAKHVVAAKSLIKTGDSTEVRIQYENHESGHLSYSWSADYGSITSDGERALYKASANPCTATIKVQISSDQGCRTDSIKLVVYKQIIIFKADDLQFSRGSLLSEEWLNFINLVKNKNIKAGLGLIGGTLENLDIHSLKQIKEIIGDDRIELWNHGYNHIVGQADDEGNLFWEFKNTPLEQQRRHLLMTQELAKEKLDLVLRTFGAPGNAFDQNTVEALDSVGDIKVWLFGSNESGKLVLGRFAEIEFPTHYPDYNRFIGNYDSSKEILVLQIHPNSWDPARLGEFGKIVDFLAHEKATFLTPYEFYQHSR